MSRPPLYSSSTRWTSSGFGQVSRSLIRHARKATARAHTAKSSPRSSKFLYWLKLGAAGESSTTPPCAANVPAKPAASRMSLAWEIALEAVRRCGLRQPCTGIREGDQLGPRPPCQQLRQGVVVLIALTAAREQHDVSVTEGLECSDRRLGRGRDAVVNPLHRPVADGLQAMRQSPDAVQARRKRRQIEAGRLDRGQSDRDVLSVVPPAKRHVIRRDDQTGAAANTTVIVHVPAAAVAKRANRGASIRQPEDPQLVGAVLILGAVPIGVLAVQVGHHSDLGTDGQVSQLVARELEHDPRLGVEIEQVDHRPADVPGQLGGGEVAQKVRQHSRRRALALGSGHADHVATLPLRHPQGGGGRDDLAVCKSALDQRLVDRDSGRTNEHVGVSQSRPWPRRAGCHHR